MPATRIWTIGHSTRSADEFLELLRAHTIDGLADVRTIPRSRRHPHFGREALDARLKDEGIEYRHFAELGGLRKPRPDSPNGAWRNEAFRGYADHMMTPGSRPPSTNCCDFGERRNVAVMCAEAVWWQCHRMLLSDALVARDVEVQHIMSLAASPALQTAPYSFRSAASADAARQDLRHRDGQVCGTQLLDSDDRR